MATQANDLTAFVAARSGEPISEDLALLLEAARQSHGAGLEAVLFYGSCLREGDLTDKLADLYCVVSSYGLAHSNLFSRLGNWLLPPNVYYLETREAQRTLRAKVAVISLDDFERGCDGRWFHSYIWARFAQPCRLCWSGSEATKGRVNTALAQAIITFLQETNGLAPRDSEPEARWEAGLRATYGSELRSERANRPASIVGHDQEHYLEAWALSQQFVSDAEGSRQFRWLLRRWLGKLLSVLRLMKAAFTYRGGADYLLWKIERHSGVTIEVSDWERRHPILASSWLFWRLYKKGAFR